MRLVWKSQGASGRGWRHFARKAICKPQRVHMVGSRGDEALTGVMKLLSNFAPVLFNYGSFDLLSYFSWLSVTPSFICRLRREGRCEQTTFTIRGLNNISLFLSSPFYTDWKPCVKIIKSRQTSGMRVLTQFFSSSSPLVAADIERYKKKCWSAGKPQFNTLWCHPVVCIVCVVMGGGWIFNSIIRVTSSPLASKIGLQKAREHHSTDGLMPTTKARGGRGFYTPLIRSDFHCRLLPDTRRGRDGGA